MYCVSLHFSFIVGYDEYEIRASSPKTKKCDDYHIQYSNKGQSELFFLQKKHPISLKLSGITLSSHSGLLNVIQTFA